MIAVKGLTCGYDGKAVLHGLDFTLPPGKNLAVLGPNGCGKSTLLKAFAGILPYTGEIKVAGRPLGTFKKGELATTVALMAQTFAPAFDYTVWDTVLQGRYPHQKGGIFREARESDRDAAWHAMAVTGIVHLAKTPVTRLSGGQLQRVFLARTLAQQPSLILLDEPTSHLDLKYQAELLAYLRKWSAEKERCVVGVFHDVSLALNLADYVLLLRDGEVVAFGSARDTLTAPLLRDVYDMDVAGYMRESLTRWEEIQ